MSVRLDLHLHTRLHSSCSAIPPERLVRQALKAGLDGLVITEHHYQWSDKEVEDLRRTCGAPGFLILAGFECTSRQGDILIYGVSRRDNEAFTVGMPPRDVLDLAHELGGVCAAAHPTRLGMGFDEEILELPLEAIEVQSVNMRPHEQRLAATLAQRAHLAPMASSDAHQIQDVGRYATEFDVPIQSMDDLVGALRDGRFRPAGNAPPRTQAL